MKKQKQGDLAHLRLSCAGTTSGCVELLDIAFPPFRPGGSLELSPPPTRPVTFGNFWLTIQNTTNRHVSNAFDLLGVFISFPLARAAAAVSRFGVGSAT
jgi:hypothetical protein